jgi:hypothetical protein
MVIISNHQFSLNRIKADSEQHFNQATSTFRTALIGLAALLSETDRCGLPVAFGRRPSSRSEPISAPRHKARFIKIR